jgi:U3 small nucleolar RNA-associated protein 23
MRHLYKTAAEPGGSYLIDKAKTYERRRCGHRPEDYPEPLTTKDCLASVVDPKDNKTNKHRYVVASQELEVRKHMRSILGVPLVYINRSVMIMEPMAGATVDNREKEERIKFRAGLKRGSGGMKRKREEDDEEGGVKDMDIDEAPRKKKSIKGPKEPNPLAVQKSKKKPAAGEPDPRKTTSSIEIPNLKELDGEDVGTKRKRKRKPKGSGDKGGAVGGGPDVPDVPDDEE